MLGRDIIEMRIGELRRLKVIEKAIEGQITQKAAADAIGVSERQMRRLIRAVREEGERGISPLLFRSCWLLPLLMQVVPHSLRSWGMRQLSRELRCPSLSLIPKFRGHLT